MPVGGQAKELCLNCHKSHYSSAGGCSSCHRGNPATARKSLAHAGFVTGKYARVMVAAPAEQAEWSRRIDQYGCKRCHITGGVGNRLAVDLDNATRQRSPDELARAIRNPVRAMPDFRFREERIDTAVNALLAAATKTERSSRAERQLVNFDAAGGTKADIFSKKCGGCHKALTAGLGSLGTGETAPNLSGIFSRYYPGKSFQDARWSREGLEKWIRNPRRLKKEAVMQPVETTATEFSEIVRILSLE